MLLGLHRGWVDMRASRQTQSRLSVLTRTGTEPSETLAAKQLSIGIPFFQPEGVFDTVRADSRDMCPEGCRSLKLAKPVLAKVHGSQELGPDGVGRHSAENLPMIIRDGWVDEV